MCFKVPTIFFSQVRQCHSFFLLHGCIDSNLSSVSYGMGRTLRISFYCSAKILLQKKRMQSLIQQPDKLNYVVRYYISITLTLRKTGNGIYEYVFNIEYFNFETMYA